MFFNSEGNQPMSDIGTNEFVWTLDQNGIGQVIHLDGEHAWVRFFQSPNQAFEAIYPLERLERGYLSPHTRVYLEDDSGHWKVGRVIHYFLDSSAEEGKRVTYEVQFPNQVNHRIPERDLRVRCLLPIEDPATVLAGGGMETQYFFDARRSALECIAGSRAAGHGLTGLLSASVELLPHQVQVVRRILQDPIQRYLLADEVGLGKTIEAGAVVHQAVIDNPNERVAVLVPTALQWQWEKELRSRFFLSSRNVRILSHEETTKLAPGEIGTLVIDEAHHLIPDAAWADGSYRHLESVAQLAPRVLLITATPALGNENLLLALLHLLDPAVYSFETKQEFVSRLHNRQGYGRLLLALNPNAPKPFLRNTLAKVREAFPDDDIIDGITSEISKDYDGAAHYITRLQRYIADTYRLHQRLLRTRRRDLPEWVLVPRQGEVVFEEDDDERTPLMADALESWRLMAIEHLEDVPDESLERHLAYQYVLLLEALGQSPEECRQRVERIAEGGQSFVGEADALSQVLNAFSEETLGTREELVTAVVHSAVRRTHRNHSLAKVVVISSSSRFAESLSATVEASGDEMVFKVTAQSSDEEVDKAVEGFRTTQRDAVLVGDRRAGEGLNLQFATAMVHADLPFDPAHIEQRIGRVDRIGRHRFGEQFPQWVVIPYTEGPNPWMAWFQTMRDTFHVFGESISELQFLLDDLREQVELTLFRRGAQGLTEAAEALRRQITDERQRLDEEYALDSRAMVDDDASLLFDRLDAADHARAFQPLQRLLIDTLRFCCLTSMERDDVFTLRWSERTLVPRRPWQELFTSSVLASRLTYQRSVATTVRDVRLVRPGLQIVDAVERLMRWDDRGIAFATWRVDPAWDSERWGDWIGFRLSYVIQPEVLAVHTNWDQSGKVTRSAIQRRLDALLPPWTTLVDIGVDGRPVTDDLLREILKRGYSTVERNMIRDYNLGSRQELLFRVIEPSEFQQAVHQAREAGEELVRNSSAYRSWWSQFAEHALRTLAADSDRLTARKRRAFADSAIEIELDVNALLAQAIRQTAVRLDGMGLIVVSNAPPKSDQESIDADEDSA